MNLNKYAYNKFSQFGEDGIINKIFQTIPCKKQCVEFGAWDGKYLSNTYELIINHNWTGVLIEGNKRKFKGLRKTYKNNNNVILVNKIVNTNGNLNAILRATDLKRDFDLLSIDIDGNDYHVWNSLTDYKPKLVIIEFNPSIPNDIEFVQEKNPKVNHGNSLFSLVRLGKSKGYELIAATICNAFFIREQYFDLFNIEDNSITSLWNTEEDPPRIFQLYDGTLVLSHPFRLIWKNKWVDKFDLQIIPSRHRHLK